MFPGNKGKPISDATMNKVLRGTWDGEHTIHGFRSSFTDWSAETGFGVVWAEAALAHGNPDKTEAAYKRTTYLDQRREKLMPAWAAYALGGQSKCDLALRKSGLKCRA